MFRSFIIVLCAFLLPTPAYAKDWNIRIPAWVDTLSSTLSTTDEAKRRDVACLAMAVYYESRGESLKGQRAVASVVMNRVRSPRFPDTVCEVIFQPHQFSFIRFQPLRPSGPSWEQAISIGSEFADRETTDNGFLYFSSESHLKGVRIGNHVFR